MRLGRIELPSHPWQGRVLPLNHGRKYPTEYLSIDYTEKSEKHKISSPNIYSFWFFDNLRYDCVTAPVVQWIGQ